MLIFVILSIAKDLSLIHQDASPAAQRDMQLAILSIAEDLVFQSSQMADIVPAGYCRGRWRSLAKTKRWHHEPAKQSPPVFVILGAAKDLSQVHQDASPAAQRDMQLAILSIAEDLVFQSSQKSDIVPAGYCRGRWRSLAKTKGTGPQRRIFQIFSVITNS
ncbi:MAG: hypothetical protein AAGU04_07675 [Anaerolineaceae bacterium]